MTYHNPLVSVLIPCYNAQSFLQDAIESINHQSYRPIEVVIISDDRFDYATLPLRFAKDVSVRFCNTGGNGSGASHAKNIGLEYASGIVIAKLDADDVLEPEYLEKLVPAVLHDGACLTGREPVEFDTKPPIATRVCSNFGDLKAGHITIQDYIHIRFNWDAAYHRELISDHHRWINTFEEDLYFECAIFERVGCVPFDKSKNYLYRMRAGSICNQSQTLHYVTQSYGQMIHALRKDPRELYLNTMTAQMLDEDLTRRLANIGCYLEDRRQGMTPPYQVLVDAIQYQRQPAC